MTTETPTTAVQPGATTTETAATTTAPAVTPENTTAPATPPAQPERPAWLPEKFKDPEQMAQAYAELEKKLGQPKPEEPKPAEEPKPGNPDEAPTTDPNQARADLKALGVDYGELETEFSTGGKLSDASYEKLEKAGIPRQMVDNYIAGQQAIGQQLTTQFLNNVGGEEAYTGMVQWAASNWSKDQIAAYDKAIDTGDINQMTIAASGLRHAYEQANGTAPKLVTADTSAPSGDAFRSTAEVIAAMNDPRYKVDSAYRADVEQRLARSSVL